MNYLQKKRRRWYAVLTVPRDVRGHFGRLKFVQSLKTESEAEAKRLVAVPIAAWKEQIRLARGHDEIAAEASIYRDLLRKAPSARAKRQIMDQLEGRADDIWQAGADPYALDPEEARDDSPTWPDAQRLYKLATGDVVEIAALVDPWLTESTVGDKTKDTYRSNMRLLAAHHPTAQTVTRRAVSEFVRGVLAAGRAPATVNRMLSGYSSFWRWLADRGYISEDTRNPWERQRLSTKSETSTRQAFSEDDATAFLGLVARTGNKHPDDLSIAMLQAVTGVRADEAAQLTPGDVRVDDQGVAWISITQAKTKSGVRTVPVVDKTVCADLQARSGNPEWVFPHLTADSYGNRAQFVSQRLSRALDKVNPDPTLVANHSWRHRARTLLEHAGISPWVADWYMGHTRQGEGLGRYSQGPSQEQLIEAARAIPLPMARRQGPVVV